MEPNAPGLMDNFLHRFRQLEAHKDLSNALIRDILTYCDELEQRNAHLLSLQDDSKLELEEARRSRRELHRELCSAKQTIDRCNSNYDSFKVGAELDAVDQERGADPEQNRNPYVMVLIDGDGMIVSLAFADFSRSNFVDHLLIFFNSSTKT